LPKPTEGKIYKVLARLEVDEEKAFTGDMQLLSPLLGCLELTATQALIEGLFSTNLLKRNL
jgi:hypothetical protein